MTREPVHDERRMQRQAQGGVKVPVLQSSLMETRYRQFNWKCKNEIRLHTFVA
jgi:hypothetical protein